MTFNVFTRSDEFRTLHKNRPDIELLSKKMPFPFILRGRWVHYPDRYFGGTVFYHCEVMVT